MKVPFFDLSRQYELIRLEVCKKIEDVMAACQYIEGPAVANLEKQLESYLGVKHVITCGNGTDALRIALQANGVEKGDEVITTSFSFFATAEAIGQLGAIPVFADIEQDGTLNISANDIKQKITEKTKAILPVHIFGRPAEMEPLNDIAKAYGVPVIEDACQAIGAEYHKKKAGTLGTMGCFSFYPTKNLGAFGDGGMITTNDDELAEICRAVKSHAAGKRGAEACIHLYHKYIHDWQNANHSSDPLFDPYKYFNHFIGCNSRLDSIQAAILSVKLNYLDTFNNKRREIAKKYSSGLHNLPVIVPKEDTDNNLSCWHQYPILCDQKEDLICYLSENGIGAGNFYPVPLHLQKAFLELGYKKGSIPVAEEACKKTVCLPIFPELAEKEIEYVLDKIRKFYKK